MAAIILNRNSSRSPSPFPPDQIGFEVCRWFSKYPQQHLCYTLLGFSLFQQKNKLYFLHILLKTLCTEGFVNQYLTLHSFFSIKCTFCSYKSMRILPYKNLLFVYDSQ